MDVQHQKLRRRGTIVLVGFLLIGGFFLTTEHAAHVLGVLPYLLLLACPLMHLFMHHGHGAHQHGREDAPGRIPADAPANPNEPVERQRR